MKSKRSISSTFMVPLAALALALIFTGCGGNKEPAPVSWNLSLTRVTPASIDVDVVGVQPSDEAQLINMKPDDWWAAPPNNLTRKGYEDMMLTSSFQTGDTWVIDRENSMWKKWLDGGVREIMIIANLPRVHENSPNDPRRKFLRLGKDNWKEASGRTIKINIQDDRVRVITPYSGK